MATPSEEIRITCLQFAVGLSVPEDGARDIVEKADAFEDFVTRGGA